MTTPLDVAWCLMYCWMATTIGIAAVLDVTVCHYNLSVLFRLEYANNCYHSQFKRIQCNRVLQGSGACYTYEGRYNRTNNERLSNPYTNCIRASSLDYCTVAICMCSVKSVKSCVRNTWNWLWYNTVNKFGWRRRFAETPTYQHDTHDASLPIAWYVCLAIGHHRLSWSHCCMLNVKMCYCLAQVDGSCSRIQSSSRNPSCLWHTPIDHVSFCVFALTSYVTKHKQVVWISSSAAMAD